MAKKLSEYQKKRNINKTPEPSGSKAPKNNNSLIFVVQKHDASHLHYDVRLEINNVLVSWAVPKGPPLRTGIRRLAIMTEDHPMAYATFEGVIPEGNYGAGTVEIWDTGTFYNIKEDANGKPIPLSTCLKKGQIEIYFEGHKLKGPYALIHTHMSNNNQWLMLKMKKK